MNSSSKETSRKGFTLVELLVVIGILAILAGAVVVVLNPAELFKQSRDAQRLSDFDALRSSIALYLSTAQNPQFTATNRTQNTNCYSISGTCNVVTSTAIDGTGWVPINFNDLTNVGINPPLSALPTDPVNNASYHYAGGFTSSNTYELDTVLESTKYASKMSTDGGSSSTVYEVGNDPGLDL